MIAVAIQEHHWAALTELLDNPNESAAFLIAGVSHSGDDTTLLVREVMDIPDISYTVRTPKELEIRSSGLVPPLGAAADDNAVAIFVHTHPNGSAVASDRDDVVDASLKAPAQHRSRNHSYASITLGGTPQAPSFTGRIWVDDDDSKSIERLRVVGRRIAIHHSEDSPAEQINTEIFDRHVRAFGSEGQQALSALRVGVVGLGGTGSAVCEQLVRLGVKHLVLIDPDVITETNITRIHGATASDIGSAKVAVARARAEAIWAEDKPTVASHNGSVTKLENAKQLTNLDVVFGCTDDQRGRGVLSRLAYWYLITVIDMGVVIASDPDGSIEGIYGRVSTMIPGTPCLLCREHISPDGMRYETLTPEEVQDLAQEGYIPGLDDPDPSVGVFTTMTASFALNALLDRLFGYGGETGSSNELIIRVADLYLSRSTRTSKPGSYCQQPAHFGRGDAEPILGISW